MPKKKNKNLRAVELKFMIIFDGHNIKNMFCRSDEVAIEDGEVFERSIPKNMAVDEGTSRLSQR